MLVSYRKAKYLKTLTNKLYISKLEVIEIASGRRTTPKSTVDMFDLHTSIYHPHRAKAITERSMEQLRAKKNAYRFVNKKVMKVTEEKSVIFT